MRNLFLGNIVGRRKRLVPVFPAYFPWFSRSIWVCYSLQKLMGFWCLLIFTVGYISTGRKRDE